MAAEAFACAIFGGHTHTYYIYMGMKGTKREVPTESEPTKQRKGKAKKGAEREGKISRSAIASASRSEERRATKTHASPSANACRCVHMASGNGALEGTKALHGEHARGQAIDATREAR